MTKFQDLTDLELAALLAMLVVLFAPANMVGFAHLINGALKTCMREIAARGRGEHDDSPTLFGEAPELQANLRKDFAELVGAAVDDLKANNFAAASAVLREAARTEIKTAATDAGLQRGRERRVH